MKIYHVKRNDRSADYGEYESFIVVADNEKEAKSYHPQGHLMSINEAHDVSSWTQEEPVITTLGSTEHGIEKGVVLAEYVSM